MGYFVPVLRFYASLRHTSSHQGNAAPGAKGPVATSIGVDEETVNYKPDCSGKPTALDLKRKAGQVAAIGTVHSFPKKQLSVQC
ncbi:hypothetical protein ACTJKN_24435 [Pedobacter sp. 22163]|uniref:hypothetical protein n=1 Tax=Pedobacter sp. 22163 TaxID=3453883 RepID=UPI003F875469